MYVVYVVDVEKGDANDGLLRAVAWFNERDRALDYADFLHQGGAGGEFTRVRYLSEDYVTGTGYVFEDEVHR